MKKIICVLMIGLLFLTCSCTKQNKDTTYPETGKVQNTQKVKKEPYKIVEKTFESESAKVKYPQIEAMEDKDLQQKINTSLKNALKQHIDDSTPDAPFSTDYEVTYKDDDILSIIYRGKITHNSYEYDYLQSVNFDLKSGQPISFYNLLKDDEKSISHIKDILRQAYFEKTGKNEFQSLGFWTEVYFTEDNLVFYYLESDTSTQFIELPVSLEKIKPYFNEEIKPVDEKKVHY